MDFRRARPEDAFGIEEMERDIFPDPWSYRDIVDLISTEGAMCFSAVDNGRVIAYVIGRLIPPEGEIYRVAVREESRKRGIAYRLLDFAMKTSRGSGLECAFLEVRSENTPAIKLYTAYGFAEVGRRKKYYRDPEDDAIVMMKGLGAYID